MKKNRELWLWITNDRRESEQMTMNCKVWESIQIDFICRIIYAKIKLLMHKIFKPIVMLNRKRKMKQELT